MNSEQNEILGKITDELDIPDGIYQQVVARYKSVGRWLERNELVVKQYSPIIYPQGSVQLGTIVKPITDDDQYDIDLVCELMTLNKGQITQAKLKELVGIEVKRYAEVNAMNARPKEGRRCWILEYADTSKFHIDILPSVPDGTAFTKSLLDLGLSNQWSIQALAITDNKSQTYNLYSQNWPISNPKGYSEWFRSRMSPQVFKAAESRVEPVAQYPTKTVLQRSIQILKRHRDIKFDGRKDDKPISIILTTLAAHAYNGEMSLRDALLRIVNNMEYYIQVNGGQVYIPNPSNPRENFADKWQEYPQRERFFRGWLMEIKQDFNHILSFQDTVQFVEALSPLLGERTVNQAAAQILESSETTSFGLQKAIVLPFQFFNVAHRQHPRWRENIQGKVTIECVKTKNGFKPRLLRSGSPISKHWSLFFKASTNISHPYDVFWQVVNTGEEARGVNQLRGGFYDGASYKKARQWHESTLYQGNHWIECFIIKDEVIVARSGEFVVNIIQ